MDERNWPKVLNNLLTEHWYHLKNKLVMKDIIGFLIPHVVTRDYWRKLSDRPISEEKRTEDFLQHVMKFNRAKYKVFLNALDMNGRSDLVKRISVPKGKRNTFNDKVDGVNSKPSEHHGDESPTTAQQASSTSMLSTSMVTNGSSRSDQKPPTPIVQKGLQQDDTDMTDGKHSDNVAESEQPIKTDNDGSPYTNSREMKDLLVRMKQMKDNTDILQDNMKALNTRVVTLENDKTESEKTCLAEVSEIKEKMKNMQMSYDQILEELRTEMACKEKLCQDMEAKIDGYDTKLQLVEEDKSKTEQKLREQTKTIQSLKHDLKQRESEIVNMKTNVEEKAIANNTLSTQVCEVQSENSSLLEDTRKRKQYTMTLEVEVLNLRHQLMELKTDNERMRKELRLKSVIPKWTNKKK